MESWSGRRTDCSTCSPTTAAGGPTRTLRPSSAIDRSGLRRASQLARPPVVLPAASTDAYNPQASVPQLRRGVLQAFVSDLLRALPSVDRLLQDERLVAL